MLYLIGLGLNDEKDITLKGLEAVKKCNNIYLENYTSKLNVDIKDLEKFYNKKIIVADRNLIENSNQIIEDSKNQDVALLIIGDVFSATTHINFILECKKHGINYKIIHNASILTAVGGTGLDLYKFGKTTSIPFDNENVKAPIEVISQNLKNNFHTLILLDLDPSQNKYMEANDALMYLIKNGISGDKRVLVCSELGGNSNIVYGSINKLVKLKFEKFPQSLVIPSEKLHFIEEEAINLWKV